MDLLKMIRHHIFNVVLITAFIAVWGLGLWGWWDRLPLPGETVNNDTQKFLLAVFRTFRAFVFGDEYASPAKYAYDWRLGAAGGLGAFVAVGTFLKAGAKLFYGPLARFRADWRKDHVVVLGDREFARKAAHALAVSGRKVSHHTGLVEMEHDGVLTVPRRNALEDTFMARSLRNAERIVVAETSDSATAETCLRLARKSSKTPIFAVFENPWLAETVRHTPGGKGDCLIAISESAAMARTALVPLPPFLLAQRAKQQRIHVFIVGLDCLGEALIENLLNSNMVLGQKTPRITVLDREIGERQAAFEARHPYLVEQSKISTRGPIDIDFVSGDAGALEPAALQKLKTALKLDPVTVVYMAVGEDNTPLALALSLIATARREELFDAPVLVPARKGCGIATAGLGAVDDKDNLLEFGSWDDIILASGILDETPDALARKYHQSYEETVWKQDAANVQWSILPESFRVSNRRAVEHIPAKLASLGFDLAPHLQTSNAVSPNAFTGLSYKGDFYRKDQRENIARLEHERWMMDRWLSGWRYGAGDDGKKDMNKKLHPDLIIYDALNDDAKDKDLVFADWLEDWLQQKDDGLKRS